MSQTMMNLIKKYVSNVHEIYGTHLRQVNLYGSYARGDYNTDIKPIAKSEEHFYKWIENYPFYTNVNKEGVTLYAA